MPWLSLAALALLAFSLPFELDEPLWQIGSLVITNVELLLFLTLALTTVSFLIYNLKWVQPDRYWWWLLPFVGGLFLSALLAPQLVSNAFKAALRLISGMLLALAVLQIIRRREDGRTISIVLVAGGLIATFIGWWEVSQSELDWASLFRSHITRVGSFLRLTGTFDYANQAAMFIEATLPFLLAAAWSVSAGNLSRRYKIPLLAIFFLLILFYLQASVLTLSRASFATIILVCLLLGIWLTIRQPASNKKMAKWWLGLAALTAVLIVANFILNPQLRLRLQGGNVDEWYRAQIVVPPNLEMADGATLEVPVTVINDGALVWRSQGENPFLLGARWINRQENKEYGAMLWPFPDIVNPQDTVKMTVPLIAPPDAGAYELRWDVVHKDVTWFGNKSGLYTTSSVTVIPDDGQGDWDRSAILDRAAWDYGGPEPNRTTLWTLGLHMLQERPLFGIGLDNFRLIYGEQLNDPNYDITVHTNNFYLELLVSLGIIGGIPFLIWLAALFVDLLRTLRQLDLTMWQVAVAAGLLAFFIHGFLDFFLLFNATGLLFWLLAGLWISEKRGHAYRI
jgi:hypothetical protein